jgi:hypothetical protein
MSSKNTPIKLKRIPYNLALILLTAGASLILGLLSFGGMYVLAPTLPVVLAAFIVPLAFAAFILSVAYEGEIYLQNIKGALAKLFKKSYIEQHLTREYLLQNLPEDNDEECPQFFKDYKAQLRLLTLFGHKTLDKESKFRKKKVEKTLSDMEQWFAKQLFKSAKQPEDEQTAYAKELQKWLALHEQNQWQERLKKRTNQFIGVKVFSALAALFMGFGSIYLMAEVFPVIPFLAIIPFAFWPVLIVPMALVAGTAYGLLTYNAITDLINNDTILRWYHKLRDDLSKGFTARNLFMTVTAVFLAALAIALTVCTAGTWWTIASNVNAQPLFEWMKKIPSFIMGVINPIITGLSAISFNLQNTAESLEMVDEALKSKQNIFQKMYHSVVDGFKAVRESENWLQIANPFRLVLKLSITPLRILLFLGHLVSVALTSDRMPGVPQIFAALVAIISEGFEDAHYFAGHEHEQESEQEHDSKALLKDRIENASGHGHSLDIPTWLLKTIATPLYALAAAWDSLTSKLNPNKTPSGEHTECSDHSAPRRHLTLGEAWNKQRGIIQEERVELPAEARKPSPLWQKEHVLSLIEHKESHLADATFNSQIAQDKVKQLALLKTAVRTTSSITAVTERLQTEKQNPVYNQHRLFALQSDKTETQEFIEQLPERVGLTA